jgi:PAS domain S-box-containing protein
MSPELWQLFLAGLVYLGALFLVAYAAEEGWLPAWVARHPVTYTLSLGVYATTWSFYGSVGFAGAQGYLFLTIYIGVTLAFVLAPVLLQPILRLVRDYQLSSLADLFAFRYPSRWTGTLVTVFMLIGILPYISLQIQAVVTSAQVLTQEVPPGVLALVFCCTVTLFAVLFGARQVTPREKHEGLVVAIAFESLIKLVALIAVAGYALYGVFGGVHGLNDWLAANPQAVEQLHAPLREGAWSTLLLLAFSAAFLLPRQFHMIFTENIDPSTLRTASWAFPLFLLLLNLAIPVVLWSGQKLGLEGTPDYYALRLALQEPSGLLTFLTFIGGISAASAMIIVESLALAAMCLNHLILPLWLRGGGGQSRNFYGRLLWGRRLLIALIIFTGYGSYLAIRDTQGLVQLGLISFVAVTQFLPAVVAMFAWPRATRAGFLAGVSGGMTMWFLMLVLPLISGQPSPLAGWPLNELNIWTFVTFWSLSVNVLLFVGVSLMTRATAKEQAADQACRLNAVLLLSEQPRAASVADLQRRLGEALNPVTARAEIRRALAELNLDAEERRPRQLHFLQERLQRNLSGLIGPQLARELLAIRNDPAHPSGLLVEEELEHSQSRLRGLAAELNQLRRFHRQILLDLPIGVCSLDAQHEVLIWNDRMAELSGLSADRVLGARVQDLPSPWNLLFSEFVASEAQHRYKLQLRVDGRNRWLNLHKEAIGDAGNASLALLVEDLTEQQQLEAEVAHSARLASIGTLASGVAHEIGNPLTGITCIAQNLRDEDDPEERRQNIEDILTQSRRISDIVQSLLSFARPTTEERRLTRLELAPLVDEAIRLVRLSRSGRDIHFDSRVPAELWVEGDPARLTQVLLNLLANASDASQPGGRVEIRATRGAGSVTLEVQDWGSGIPAELRERIFEPFFTTKEPGRGTGLGLPLVYRIVSDHGGSISADSQEGVGTTFTLRLPAAPDSLAAVLI